MQVQGGLEQKTHKVPTTRDARLSPRTLPGWSLSAAVKPHCKHYGCLDAVIQNALGACMPMALSRHLHCLSGAPRLCLNGVLAHAQKAEREAREEAPSQDQSWATLEVLHLQNSTQAQNCD